MNIGIIGIGGIGGYLGAKLTSYYPSTSDLRIHFIARGEHLKAINQNGIKLITPIETTVSHPFLATNSAFDCDKMDYIFYCTKSYDVKDSLRQIMPMIKAETVIIPFLNGVLGYETLKEALPDNLVCEACAYIFSEIDSPGVIKETTPKNFFYFGDSFSITDSLIEIAKIARGAGINIMYSPDIKRRVWEKFEYISPLATLTAAYNITCGQIVESDDYTAKIMALYNEFESVAFAKNVLKKTSLADSMYEKLLSAPYTATTSMQRDHVAGKKTEKESLVNYIIDEAEKYGIDTPVYKELERII